MFIIPLRVTITTKFSELDIFQAVVHVTKKEQTRFYSNNSIKFNNLIQFSHLNVHCSRTNDRPLGRVHKGFCQGIFPNILHNESKINKH